MSREVIVGGRLMDFSPDDHIEITVENPVLQSVSNLKSSYTNTFSLPLTAKNQAVISALNNVNSVTDFHKQWHTYSEYRDGLPIIEEGRAKILSVNPRKGIIELYVIWGALKSLSEEIGKENINDLSGVSLTWPSSSTEIMSYDSGLWFGWLEYRTVKDMDVTLNMQYLLPNVNARAIFSKIINQVDTGIHGTVSFFNAIEEFWVPCLTKNSTSVSDVVPTENIMKSSTSGSRYTGGMYVSRLLRILSSDWGVFTPISGDSNYSLQYFNAGTYSIYAEIDMTIATAETGNIIDFEFWARTAKSGSVHNELLASHSETLGSSSAVLTWNSTTKRLTGSFKGSEILKVELNDSSQALIIDTITLRKTASSVPLAQGISPNNATINNTYTYWKASDTELSPGDKIDVIYNLPKISKIEFIKDLLSLVGGYVVYKNGEYYFDLVDNILDTDVYNIERLITTREPDAISFTYSNYAQKISIDM